VTAAVGYVRLYNQRKKSKLFNIVTIGMTVTLVISLLISSSILYVSYHNYPGGYALKRLHNIEHGDSVKVHIDVFCCMTGVSHFGEENSHWSYSKEENRTDFSPFTHLVTETPNRTGFAVIHTEEGFDGFDLKNWPNVLRFTPKAYVLKKFDFGK